MSAKQEKEPVGSRNFVDILFRWFLMKMEILPPPSTSIPEPLPAARHTTLQTAEPLPVFGELDPNRPLNATERHQPLLLSVILIHLREIASLEVGQEIHLTLPPESMAIQANGGWCTTPNRMCEYFAKVIRVCIYNINKQRIQHFHDYQHHAFQQPFIPTEMGIIREADSTLDVQIPNSIPKFQVKLVIGSIVKTSRLDKNGNEHFYKIPTEFVAKRIE